MTKPDKKSGLQRRDLLLVVPYIALLFPGLYARQDPMLFGFPFFYWYQFFWVIGGAVLTGIVFLLRRKS
jgi:hypothetical protein